MSSCEQHEAYQTARAVVCSAEAEQREAEEEQGAEGASIEEPDDDKSESEDGESGIEFDPLSILSAAGRAELRSLRCSSSN